MNTIRLFKDIQLRDIYVTPSYNFDNDLTVVKKKSNHCQ